MDVCPDCRCVLVVSHHGTEGNHSPYQDTKYCDVCLLDRVKAGEKVEGEPWTDDHGKTWHPFWVVCLRCNGTGMYLVSATQDGTDCWNCIGLGFMDSEHKGVRRTQRWWSTYQANRQPPSAKRAGASSPDGPSQQP